MLGEGKLGRPGRRLPARVCGFAAALLTSVVGPAFLSPIAAHAAPQVEVISHSTWEDTGSAGPQLHVIGQFRNNSSTDSVTEVRVDFNLISAGAIVGNSFALSTLEILGPGKVSPFEDVIPEPAPHTTTSIVDGSAASATRSVSQPYQSWNGRPLKLTVDACADPDPLSEACQNHVTGTVKNIGTIFSGGPATADNVRVIFAFFNASGFMVGQDTAEVWNGATQVLSPDDSGSFTLDRTGEPEWSGDRSTGLSAVAEAAYPLDVNPAVVSFNEQRVGVASAPVDVALKNRGARTVTISSINTTGDFSLLQSCTTIDPGETCTATVSFTPQAMGAASGSLVVANDAPGSPEIVPLTGSGVAPLISFQPTSLTFDPQQLFSSSNPKDVTLANSGTAPMTINGIASTGDFSQVHPGCGATLEAGSNCTISVTFTPTGANAAQGTLSLNSDALNSSAAVALSGTGVGPIVAFSPTSLNFGNVPTGQTSSKQVTLTNTGYGTNSTNGLLTVSQITSAAGFTQGNTCGSLPASFPPAPADGSSCAITVTFAPTTPGLAVGALAVKDGANVNHVLPLSGNGLAANATLSSTSVVFGGVTIGQASPSQTVTLTNSGGLPLNITSVGQPTSSDFQEADTCRGTTLATTGATSSCTISLTFTPKGSGPRVATVTIVDNAGSQQISLAGTGLTAGWESLGGIVASGPAASSSGSNRVDVFARGQDRALWHQSFNGTSWSGWQYLGGIITSDPAAVASTTGRIDVLARGQDNALWHRSFETGAWGGWEYLGGILASGPAVSSRGTGRLDVFVQGQDHQLWHRARNTGVWSPWEPLGGIITSDPASVSWSSNRIDVFARGQDNALWHKSFDGTHWSGWDSLGGQMTFSPDVASWASGRLDVFIIGSDRQLWRRAFDINAWGPWQPQGGILTASPAAVARTVGLIDVFGRGQDIALWHRIVSG